MMGCRYVMAYLMDNEYKQTIFGHVFDAMRINVNPLFL